jgi:membrane-associated HD superfamily phosphohydrolase
METAGLSTPGSGYQPMSIGDWIVTLIVSYLPFVGFIMLFVWAFGDGTHPSKKTWAQATLIMFVIMIILLIVFFTIFATLLQSMFNGYYQQAV